mgnify:CR=1 FL=1
MPPRRGTQQATVAARPAWGFADLDDQLVARIFGCIDSIVLRCCVAASRQNQVLRLPE